MIKTGIYGGSFNPIHNAHIALARQIMERAQLDEIWFVVSPQNPLKASGTLLDDSLRLDMVRRAVAPYGGLVASDYEFHMPRPSYMWHTLQSMERSYADRQFTLIIGADNWTCFDRWYHASDIVARYPIVIYPREGCTIDTATLPPAVRLVDTPLYNLSSTEIRDDVRAGRDIGHKVPACIADDVRRLYGQR